MKTITRKIGETTYMLPIQWKEYLGQDTLDLKKSVTARLVELGENPKTAYRLKDSLLTYPEFADWYDATAQRNLWNKSVGETRNSWTPEKKAAVTSRAVAKRQANRDAWLDSIRTSKEATCSIPRLDAFHAGDWRTFLGPEVIDHKISVTQYLSSPAFGPSASKNANKYKHKLEAMPGYMDWFDPIAETRLSRSGFTNLELYIAEHLKTLGLNVKMHDRSVLDGCEIDILLPDLNIGFEINGALTHNSQFNPFGQRPKSKTFHKDKSESAASKGVRLYHLWEHWTRSKTLDIVNSVVGNQHKVHARKLEFRQTTYKEASQLLNDSHLHNALPASFYFGLYYDDTLVSTLTFSRKDAETVELSRYCTLQGTTVIGGFQKMFKHSIDTLKEQGYKTIVSYAYRDITPDPEHSIYTRAGFKFIGYTCPGLFYYAYHTTDLNGMYVPEGVHSRQKFQAHKLKPLGLTPKDLPDYRIYELYDSGNLKFTYTIQ